MLIPALVCATAIHGAVPARSILVFSKTTGFRHDAIPVGREAILELGIDRGWSVTYTEDSAMFDSKRLKAFDAVIFLNTTGKVLEPRQEKALVSFIHGGGGFVGVHAAADCEYDWAWYGKLVGAYFLQHPAQQDAIVRIDDPSHPSTKNLPNPWPRHDEWYDYRTNPRNSVHVLASLDPSTYSGSKMPDDHPIMWCQEFEGGRSWYTGMGHTQESYKDPIFLNMLAEGIEWACGKSKREVSL